MGEDSGKDMGIGKVNGCWGRTQVRTWVRKQERLWVGKQVRTQVRMNSPPWVTKFTGMWGTLKRCPTFPWILILGMNHHRFVTTHCIVTLWLWVGIQPISLSHASYLPCMYCIVSPQLWTDMSCSQTGPLALR